MSGPPDDQPEDGGTVRRLADLAGDAPPTSIPDVVRRLEMIRDGAASTSPRGEDDGIASFTRLYHVITRRIGEMVESGEFRSSPFLVRLDLEFAQRYFQALRRYAVDVRTAPGVWRVLFDNRHDPRVPPVNSAVLGVNAHINFDLAHALVATWRHVAPDGEDAAQHHDYGLVNDVFQAEMDGLREELGSLLSHGPDGAPWDVGANWLSDLVIRFTRDLAWQEAQDVWRQGATPEVCAASERRLDAIATFIGQGVLRAPLPF
ncbi:DUF5995 family protein [Cellulomonas wangsupingiae]|uniref:DUF5995 family protein n=1 Tax=Cellulomonas wangsupingiae TaxID=2968085 RepID=A0ABY5K949_9CELL|nr:DUF5995 family protein [Cellulomonas wangsupingiae]MCC2336378.1 DUF5995 family protein [Cellulomonas wangsupingiae]MCM0640619.1 DUF5995 family protein [Cellulomonas wangsupingiae]UUI65647.1 DUF5995 family protein [Cellulomonas wangsupingiae]